MMSDRRRASIDDYRDADAVLRADLERYCSNMVTIKPKEGAAHLFRWNPVQRELHRRLERQLELTGRVRAIILKGRQVGISTYIAARFYHKVTMNLGNRCFILTHEDPATQNLFGMVKRIHDKMPADYRPQDTSNNANALEFGGLDAGYKVGTSQSTTGTGRSSTIQLFHGSEAAFWRNASDHFAGVMQAVPEAPRTEVVLESTANGIGGVFYDQWSRAERGDSDFEAIFLPWFWLPSYRREVTEDIEFSAEEREIQQTYGLDDEQLAWMHAKNRTMPGGKPGVICPLFRQEYPATPVEAFQSSAGDVLVDSMRVQEARSRTIDPETQAHAPRLLGVDVAMGGQDRTRIIDRKGRIAGSLVNKVMHTQDSREIAEQVALLLRDNPDILMCFIDGSGGWGQGVYSLLREWGFGSRIMLVNFAWNASDEDLAHNKRAEMWWLMAEWLDKEAPDIPDDDSLHRHLCASPYKFDHRRRVQLRPKEWIKEEFGFSPDGGDALALTFAAPVAYPRDDNRRPSWLQEHMAEQAHGDWMTA